MDMEKELSMLRETPSGAKFFKHETQDVFPEGDYWMCTDVDRFDFVLKVSQLEKDIFEVKRIEYIGICENAGILQNFFRNTCICF